MLAAADNFADENTLACLAKNIQKQVASLESDCEVALKLPWNKMILNKVSGQNYR